MSVHSSARRVLYLLALIALASYLSPLFSEASRFDDDCLGAHNRCRSTHKAPALVLDNKLTTYAQRRANFIAASDGAQFNHPANLPYGENLAWDSRPNRSFDDMIRMWYDENKRYDYNRARFDPQTGHFTQLVWRATRYVGCAKAHSSGRRGGIYLVCEYWPKGNVMGEHRQNVLP